MAKIDYYAKSLMRFQATEMILQSGANVQLRFPTGDRFANQQVTHENLVAIIQEIAPAQAFSEVSVGGRAQFRYDSEHGEIVVAVEPAGVESWRISLTAAADEGVQIGIGELGQPPAPAQPSPKPLAATLPQGAQPLARIQPVPAGSIPKRSAPAASSPAPAPAPTPPPQGEGLAGLTREFGAFLVQAAVVEEPAGPPPPGARTQVATPAPAPPSARAPAPTPVAPPPAEPVPVVPTAHAAAKPPRIHQLAELLRAALDLGASDLHVVTGQPPLARVRGNLAPLPNRGPVEEAGFVEAVLAMAPAERKAAFLSHHETSFGATAPGVARVRVSLFRERGGVAASIRLFQLEIPSPAELGLPRAVVDLCLLRQGLIVVTGPTASGKSTTLASLVDFVNRNRSAHVISIEDPIEIVHENQGCLVSQRELGLHTDSYASAVRIALRSDPDVLVLSDLPDADTVMLALETAARGSLVLASMNATSGPATIDRIVAGFPAERQVQLRNVLADNLRAVIAQRLCHRIDGGRVASFEILVGGSATANVIREGKTFQLFSLMQAGRGAGMRTLEDSLLEHVHAGRIAAQEAEAWASSPTEMRRILALGRRSPSAEHLAIPPPSQEVQLESLAVAAQQKELYGEDARATFAESEQSIALPVTIDPEAARELEPDAPGPELTAFELEPPAEAAASNEPNLEVDIGDDEVPGLGP